MSLTLPETFLVNRSSKPTGTVIDFGSFKIGDGSFVVMAGPCAVESEEQINLTAKAAAESGAKILRGGAFKLRTSPDAFQGLGETGLRFLAQAARRHGLLTISEAIDT